LSRTKHRRYATIIRDAGTMRTASPGELAIAICETD
jgi:hypothetical protein